MVPICEHSHWFVAVICFPGMIGKRRMDNDEPILDENDDKEAYKDASKTPTKGGKKDNKKVLQIGSTSIFALKSGNNISHFDDDSDRDEADASDDDMVIEEDESGLLNRFKANSVNPDPKAETPKAGLLSLPKPVPSTTKSNDSSEADPKDPGSKESETKEGEVKNESNASEQNEEKSSDVTPDSTQEPSEAKIEETKESGDKQYESENSVDNVKNEENSNDSKKSESNENSAKEASDADKKPGLDIKEAIALKQ